MAGLLFPFYWAYPSDPPPNSGTAALIALKQKYPNLDVVVVLGHVMQSMTPGNYISYADYWNTACNQLRAGGVKVLAYIYSNSWNITLAQTEQAADTYINTYPQIDGFFVDEWGAYGDNPGTMWPLSNYQALVTHIKSKGNYLILGNANNFQNSSYLDTGPQGADLYMVSESSGSLPSNSWLSSLPVPKSRRSVDVYGLPSASVTDAEIIALAGASEYFSITPYDYLSVIDQAFFDRQMSLMTADGLLPEYGEGTAVILGAGALVGVSAATSTASITGIGVALGSGNLTGVLAATAVANIEGIGIMVNRINQIRAPDGTLRIWRNTNGDPITLNPIAA